MSIVQKSVTAEEFLAWPKDGFHHELWKGEVFTMSPSGFRHGFYAARLARILDEFVSLHRLGVTTGAETGFLLERDPDSVLAADAAFVRQARVEQAGMTESFFPGPPDLAVEVQSPRDSGPGVLSKVNRWLNFGTQQVWVLRPRSQTVDVYMSAMPGMPTTYGLADQLPGGDLLPGFAVAVERIFQA